MSASVSYSQNIVLHGIKNLSSHCLLLAFHVPLCRQRCWNRCSQEGVLLLMLLNFTYLFLPSHFHPSLPQYPFFPVPIAGWHVGVFVMTEGGDGGLCVWAVDSVCSVQMERRAGVIQHRRPQLRRRPTCDCLWSRRQDRTQYVLTYTWLSPI